MSLTRPVTTFTLFASALALMTGCGSSEPKRQAVSGTVKFQGKEIEAGTISFRSDGDGKYVGTGTITKGKYEIPAAVGLVPAKYRVAVTYPDPKIPAPRPDEPPGPSTPVRELLPKKYNDQTELTAEIKDGPNDVSFDLK